MKKLVVIPADSLPALEYAGRTWQQVEKRYNVGGLFDEVYCLHPSNPEGDNDAWGKVKHIKAEPSEYGKLIQAIAPDMVRGYGGMWGSIYTNAYRSSDVPMIVSVHDVRPEWIDPSLRFSDRVLCVSEAVKQAVIQLARVPEERLEILPNRVDTKVFSHQEDVLFKEQMREKYGDGKFILHVGRKSWEKNIDTLVKALKFLPDEYKAVFLGAGNSDEYKALSQEEGVASRCFFEGSVKKSILPSYYSWCDCMCTPSRSEGFGIVFIEAAACECAIVTSDIAPMNEFLENGKNAFLVKDYLNPAALAEGIRSATESSTVVKQVKKEARLVGYHFEADYVNQMEADIYKDVLNHGVNKDALQELEEEKRDDRKVILFGAGRNGRVALRLLRERAAYFVDNNRELEGAEIDGIQVISYKTLLQIHRDYRIVVTPKIAMAGTEIIKTLVRDGIDFRTLEWYMAINKLPRIF